MTVGELREALARLPQDVPIGWVDEEWGEFAELDGVGFVGAAAAGDACEVDHAVLWIGVEP
jgi:hypothetical protein